MTLDPTAEVVVVNKYDLADPVVLARLQRREKDVVLVSALIHR